MSDPAEKVPDGRHARSSGVKTLSDILREREPVPGEKKRRRQPRASDAKVAQARVEMETFAASGDWDAAKGLHLVMLFEFLHAEVYGVDPLDLDAKSRFLAARLADGFVAKFFDADYGECVRFMRWKWLREKESVKWRAANGRDPGRPIGWRLQFSPVLVTEYRMHGERKDIK